MKTVKILLAGFFMTAIFLGGCKTMNKSQKGAAIGVAGGAAVGAVIGKAAGNTAMGAIIRRSGMALQIKEEKGLCLPKINQPK